MQPRFIGNMWLYLQNLKYVTLGTFRCTFQHVHKRCYNLSLCLPLYCKCGFIKQPNVKNHFLKNVHMGTFCIACSTFKVECTLH